MTRREFGVAIGAGAGTLSAPAASKGMYVSLNGAITGKVEWTDFMRLAAKCGYGGVDVNLDAAMKQGAEATRKTLAELKLRPAVTNLPVNFRGDDAAFGESMKKLDEQGAFAAAIGCPRMVTWIVSSSDKPKEEQRKLLKDRFTAIGAALNKHKVRLGLEFLGPLHIRKSGKHPFIWRMDEMLAFAKECGPNMGLLLDAWHWHHAEGTAADILAAGRKGIVHIHVADSPKMPPEQVKDNQRIFPGEGAIDLTAFFQALQKVGYEDGVSPEVIGGVTKETPAEEGAMKGLKTTLAVLRKANVRVS